MDATGMLTRWRAIKTNTWATKTSDLVKLAGKLVSNTDYSNTNLINVKGKILI